MSKLRLTSVTRMRAACIPNQVAAERLLDALNSAIVSAAADGLEQDLQVTVTWARPSINIHASRSSVSDHLHPVQELIKTSQNASSEYMEKV